MQRTVTVLLRVLDVILDTQHLDVALRGQIIRHGIHVVAVVADHAYARHVEQVVLDGVDGQRQVAALQLAEDRVKRFETAFHMVNWIMGEAHLEFRVKNFQFGADLVHRTLIHLHLVDELGDLFGGKGSLADVDVLQTHLQFGGVNSILPVKYHGRTVYRLAFRKTERMLCIEEGQCPAIAPRTGRSRVPKRLCRPADSMVRYE